MFENIFGAFSQARNSTDRGAIIADAAFEQLSSPDAQIARQTIILHWFDEAVIGALVHKGSRTKKEPKSLFEQLCALPFVERIPWGWAIQHEIRLGLLNMYGKLNPQPLKVGARLAAPVFLARAHEDSTNAAEALFCLVVSGQTQRALALLDRQLEKDAKEHDWRHMQRWFEILQEAEQLPFVQPLQRSEWYDLLQGQLYELEQHWNEAIDAYSKALAKNSTNILVLLSRGAVYAKLQRQEEAAHDLLQAIDLGPGSFESLLSERKIQIDTHAIYLRALESAEQLFGKEHPLITSLLANLTDLGWVQEGSTRKERRRSEIVEIPRISPPPGQPFAVWEDIPLRRLPVYLLLDASGSMYGPKIIAVNNGVQLIYHELLRDPLSVETVYISVIVFADGAYQTPLLPISQFTPPELSASGKTAMGAAFQILNESLDQDIIRNKAEIKGDYTPMVFLMTDGVPTDEWRPQAQRLVSLKGHRTINMIGLGIGEDADVDLIKQVSTVALRMNNVTPENIRSFFKWVSTTISTTSLAVTSTRTRDPGIELSLPPAPSVTIVL